MLTPKVENITHAGASPHAPAREPAPARPEPPRRDEPPRARRRDDEQREPERG